MQKLLTIPMCALALACASPALAQSVITRWSFNGATPSLTSDNAVGSSIAIGGLTQLFDGGSPADTGTPNQSMRLQQWSPSAPSGSQGAEFSVPTTGFNTISVKWDQRFSNSSSRFTQFSYSINGTSFITTGLANNGVFTQTIGDSWVTEQTVDLSAITAVNNNPNFKFRITAIHDPNGTAYVATTDGSTYASSATGGYRYDRVTVQGIAPQPVNPIVTPSVEPAALCNTGGSFVISALITPGLNPDSTGIAVVANLSSLGGSSSVTLLDDGAAPDLFAGDFIYSASTTLGAQSIGPKTFPVTVTDAQLRTDTANATFNVVDCNTASTAQVVISQIYGGGSNLGPPASPINADYVELYNRSGATVDLSNWSVQYAGPTAAGGFDNPADRVNLSGVIKPGQYLLVRFKDAGNTGAPIPTPDFSVAPGTGGMGNNAGRVALVRTQALIGTNCNDSNIEDLVGYGLQAICFEGAAPAPTLQNTAAAFRVLNGAQDSNQNFNDFTAAAPTPRNRSAGGFIAGYASASAGILCPGSPITFTVNAVGATSPASTGINVTANLSTLGGSVSSPLTDTGGGVYTLTYNIPGSVTPGFKNVSITVADAQSRSDTSYVSVGVGDCTPSNAPVVISQFFCGQNSSGSAGGASFVADFVEIFNRTGAAVSLNNWSLQYADGGAAITFNGSKQVNLSGSIGPGEYRLIQVGPTGTTGGLLPTPDFTASPTFGMDNASGKIALVNSTTPIDANCAASSVVDLVGYGPSVSCYEGLAGAIEIGNANVGLRLGDGCTDRNQSALDISIEPPLNFPRNSASPANACVLPTGACCVGTTCTIASSAACSGAFQGVATTCGPVGNPTTCCKANFNQTAGVTVQDIFDFLNAWFAGNPAADINGGGISVQDIFDFLNAWFAGC